MPSLIDIIAHLTDEVPRRQRHMDRMQQLRNEAAAYGVLKVATVLQGGVASNIVKGTAPFAYANERRGLATVAIANPLVSHTIYTAAPPPSPSHPRRSRR